MKYGIVYFTLLLLFLSCSLTREAKIIKNKETLLTKKEDYYFSNFENFVYIPELMDARYYRTGKYDDCEYCEKPDFEMKKIVKAFYDLYKILTPEEVKELLHSPSPVMRVYAYFYYIGKFKDVNIGYLKEQIESMDTVAMKERHCYVADPMILAAIGGIDIQYMFFTEFMRINPTREQRDDLYERYLKRGKHENIDLTYRFEEANIREEYKDKERDGNE